MGKHLVLAGGGHAHMTVMRNLERFRQLGHRVTLVSPDPYHYYSGMGPGLLGGTYRPQQVRFHVRRMVEDRGGTFLADRVVRIDAARRELLLASGTLLPYDVASFNTGSGVPLAALDAGPGVTAVKPIHQLLEVRQQIRQALTVGSLRLLVVGGGPAGVELAGNLWRLVDQAGGAADLTLLAGRRLLGAFPEGVRRRALASLMQRGIAVREGLHVTSLAGRQALLSDGNRLPFDFALVATGVQPSTIFRDSGLPVGPDGGLLVNRQLQAVGRPELFGGGDCISFQPRPLAKVGVYAVRQNPILFANLMAALEGRALQPFQPQQAYLLILNLGDGRGVFNRGRLTLGGRWVFALKDRIDRAFMARFQVSGELAEADREIKS